jgi:hypothetical protein
MSLVQGGCAFSRSGRVGVALGGQCSRALLALIPVLAARGGTESVYSDTRHGNAPPAAITYSLPSTLHRADRELGDSDAFVAHASYVMALPDEGRWRWLVGADYRLLSFNVPKATPLPTTLQSAALAIGFQGSIGDRWQLRVEALPGVYGDLSELGTDQVNVPLALEASYEVSDRLTVGGQVLVDARRESPVVGSLGITWKAAERWSFQLWLPRPQIEFHASRSWTIYAGASVNGGSFVVDEAFGTNRGEPGLDGAALDYREIRVGGGLRWSLGQDYLLNLAWDGRWTGGFAFTSPGWS